MDVIYAPPISVSSVDGCEVQIGVVGRHRGQHPQRSVEHAVRDERPNFIQDLRQLDGGRTGARSRPKHLGDHHLRNVAKLVELSLESASLLEGLGY